MTSPSTFRLGYRPALDGLRALAILLVIGFHAALSGFRGGFLGVDLFFVLSGFLITTILVQEIQATGAVNLRRFYMRRILRLFPALAFIIFGYLLLAATDPDIWRHATKIAAILLTYTTNWVMALTDISMGIFAHTWSLAVEEQFYILFPLLLVAVVPRLTWRQLRIALLVGIGLICLWRLFLWSNGATWQRLYFGLDTRADALLWGCWLGVTLSTTSAWQSPRLHQWARRLILPVIGLYALLNMTASDRDVVQSLWLYPLVALLVTCILYYVIVIPPTWLHRVLEFSWLVRIGKISYGLYLWHFPIFETMSHLGASPLQVFWIGTPVSLAISLLSYFVVERPFLKRKNQAPSPLLAPAES